MLELTTRETRQSRKELEWQGGRTKEGLSRAACHSTKPRLETLRRTTARQRRRFAAEAKAAPRGKAQRTEKTGPINDTLLRIESDARVSLRDRRSPAAAERRSAPGDNIAAYASAPASYSREAG